MKSRVRNLFAFLIDPLEQGDKHYVCKPYSRTILLFISAVFGGLAILVFLIRSEGSGLGSLLPVVVFGIGSICGLIVGFLANDRAIARIWGSR